MTLLTVKQLSATVNNKTILNGVDLTINPGEIHAIMGPNGSGKSTLASVLAGKPDYAITGGSVSFDQADLLELDAHERACTGLFLGFQYPVEIPGVATATFLRTALNNKRKANNLPAIDAMDFLSLAKEKMAMLEMDPAFLQRAVNEGFSGGEKKRHDILQMLLLDPKLAILDETDSGLDIDALQVIAKGINQFKDSGKAVLLITHYQRLLDYIPPDYVHVFAHGKIIKSGDKTLAQELEAKGYGWIEDLA